MSGSRSIRLGILRSWWRDPLDYRWLVRTFKARGALGMMKSIVVMVSLSLAVITGLSLYSTAGPAGWARAITVFTTTMMIAGTVLWGFWPWPNERFSLARMATVDVLITCGCLADSNRLFGTLSLMMLVAPGGYIAMFHGPRVLVLHEGWSLVSVLLLAGLMLREHGNDVAEAASVVLTTAAVTVMLMPALQFCYWVLRIDALTDPLTGLLNRRGLDYYSSAWFRPRACGPLGLITVDLDRFKNLNDTYGHSAGDQALVRVATCLRASVPSGTVVARSGGEEFIILTRLAEDSAVAEAERMCQAVESDCGPVTASVGVAVTDSGPVGASLQDLIRSSDAAMYRAKQLGGNMVVVTT
ncbi:diguanylate cyclase [Nocardia sp. SYP-A9097]|uniref:GGDEF domain-containing protein n=1 Tax=Nocardia sp. SYP-A9097 TaxID=2663237 RepID=UPI00129A664D|nr:GGDEF domain-containing protein [Nocardia sp. SYP-A9097]MRH93478.1 diguanylate cyclase [Nocardia sp. SYP-A9097]